MEHRIPSWPRPRSLMQRLDEHARRRPGAVAFSFLGGGGFAAADLSYAGLRNRALAVAQALRARRAEGSRVLLVLPPGLDYIACFLGCLYAGAIAVPVYPPRRNRLMDRVVSVAADSAARFVIAPEELRRELGPRLAPALPYGFEWLQPGGEPGAPDDWPLPYCDWRTPAFLQYTSGSTAEPRGAVVTHGGLEHNIELQAEAYDMTPEQVLGVSWLPPYHDLGLIGTVLAAVHHGVPDVLMAPQTFLSDPIFWLRAISHFRATSSAAPDSAYDLCAARATHEDIAGLDLRSWNTAFSGAEPVRPATLERFARVFAPCGFSAKAWCPGYGLAEATLVVAARRRGLGPVIRSFDRGELGRSRVSLAAPGAPGAIRLAASGEVLGGQRVVIADPESRRSCPPDVVGEIWVAGPSVARGYWGKPELSGEVFGAHLADTGEGPFLRTGDLGFLHEGALFITGRRKDLIIIGGVNYYPQDIEAAARAAHPALADSAGAAFPVEDEGGEALAVVHEVHLNFRSFAPAEIVAAVRKAVGEEYQLPVAHCALVRFASLPKTSSGKVQRYRCRELFLGDKLDAWFTTGGAGRAAAPAAAMDGALPLPAAEFEKLRAGIASILGIDAAALDPDRPLVQQGLSSMAAVELQGLCETEFGAKLRYEDFFEPWTIRRLAAIIAERRAGG